MDKIARLQKLKEVFSPSSPIKEEDFFYGRVSQLRKVVDSINEKGQHCIVYGERGVGKTSLANIISTKITNVFPAKITCNRKDSFKSLWTKAFKHLNVSTDTKGIGFKPDQKRTITSCSASLAALADVNPSTIENILSQFSNSNLLFIFDEFDNITDATVRESFADLIKSLSDNSLNVNILIVGIADNVESLIGSHQSLERCLSQVKMPRMSNEESSEIIKSGLDKLKITIPKNVENKIIEFASGFPHYIHMLCKNGAKEVIDNGKIEFSNSYLNIAIRKGVEATSEQQRASFREAILTANSSSKWRDLVYACAISKMDQFNSFSISEIVKNYNVITGREVKSSSLQYNLNKLTTEDRGSILVKLGKGASTRYTFKNPMMKAFVKLKIDNELRFG